jgi:hypothetical protein
MVSLLVFLVLDPLHCLKCLKYLFDISLNVRQVHKFLSGNHLDGVLETLEVNYVTSLKFGHFLLEKLDNQCSLITLLLVSVNFKRNIESLLKLHLGVLVGVLIDFVAMDVQWDHVLALVDHP